MVSATVSVHFIWSSAVEIKCQLDATEVFLLQKYHRQQPLCNTLELLMIGIVVPETC